MPPPTAGVFAANPLSLSVPEPAFESWLRDTGYLEVLDERSASSSSSSSSASAANEPRHRVASSDSTASNTEAAPSSPSLLRGGLRGAVGRFGGSALVGVVRTLMAILTTNPFAKLTTEDFSGNTPPWTDGFLTSGGGGGGDQVSSYSWPVGPSQARMRVHENVKRYARNYASLWLLFFACTLNCSYPLLLQSSGSCPLCDQHQLYCYDLACFSTKADVIKTISWGKPIQKVSLEQVMVLMPDMKDTVYAAYLDT